MSSVTLEKIEKRYGENTVIHNLDLSIADGEFVSFLGPSGCGKTTCLRMVAGLDNCTSGKIKIDEDVVSDPAKNYFLPPEKRFLGMVFQSYAVWPHMNIFENVAYPLKMAKISKSEINNRVKEILKLVELDGLDERKPHTLSGGQQQRVALARGLVARPRVLLLDEPLSNLDAKLREKMRVDIRKLQQQFKITCIYVTHDQIEAFSMSDKIVILKKGEIIQQGTPQEIRSNPKDGWVEDFIRQHH